jgi:hypothetical protein
MSEKIGGNKRVKFNKFIEQIDFLKQTPMTSGEEDEEEAKEDNDTSSDSSSNDESEGRQH